MKRNLPPLQAVRVFEAAARHLSFALAARELYVTPGAVSRQIKTLEEALGYLLFVRSVRRVELTADGLRFQRAAEEALSILEQASSTSVGRKRILTISAPQSLATFWLVPRLPKFAELCPEVDLRVRTSTEPADFDRDEVDVAIRLGRLPGMKYEANQPRVPHQLVKNWQGISATHLWDEILVPVLSKKLMKKGGPLRSPSDLKNYTLLHVALRPDAWSDWFRCNSEPYPRRAQSREFGHFFMALDAAKAGHGVALAPSLFLDGLLGPQKDLICPLSPAKKSAGAYYFLCRDNSVNESAVQSFLGWLNSQA